MIQDFGKFAILLGFFLILIGLFFLFSEKVPFLGKLPGDILIKKDNFTFYAPLATSIIISIILSFLISIFFRAK